MKLFFDTSVLVNADRKHPATIDLLERAVERGLDLCISTVTVSEILFGANLREDADKAALRAKQVLGQFVWQDLDGEAAERTGQLLAYLHATGQPVEYQDVAIAASAHAARADCLVTENTGHFERFPHLEGKVFTAKAMGKRLSAP